MYEEISGGYIDKMSFAFSVAEEDYDGNTHTRTIKKVKKLYDVSAVDIPAYNETSISARSFFEGEYEKEHYSPAAVCALLRTEEYAHFGMTFCRVTIYKYIEDGNIFPTITRKNLPEKGKRKRKYEKTEEKKQPHGRSIETRPEEIDSRSTMGHWEMDTVLGVKGSRARLLVLSERYSRHEIIIKIPDGTAASVVRAVDRLERKYGSHFSKIFKSITVDNGSEFADTYGLERSCRRKRRRTILYYCHPYTACERGTNENINRMIRRRFPKGTNFDHVTPAQVREVETWINTYPREILNYETASHVFGEWLKQCA